MPQLNLLWYAILHKVQTLNRTCRRAKPKLKTFKTERCVRRFPVKTPDSHRSFSWLQIFHQLKQFTLGQHGELHFCSLANAGFLSHCVKLRNSLESVLSWDFLCIANVFFCRLKHLQALKLCPDKCVRGASLWCFNRSNQDRVCLKTALYTYLLGQNWYVGPPYIRMFSWVWFCFAWQRAQTR